MKLRHVTTLWFIVVLSLIISGQVWGATTSGSLDVGLTVPVRPSPGPSSRLDSQPSISNVVVSSTISSAEITWTASDDVGVGSAGLVFGTTNQYGNNASVTGGYKTQLSGLLTSSTYYYKITVTDTAGQQTVYASTFQTKPKTAVVETPLSITAVNAQVGATSTTITWTSDLPSYGQVNYGVSNGYTKTAPLIPDFNYQTSHVVIMEGLTPNTTYHFQVIATDQNGISTSTPDKTFVTLVQKIPPPDVSSFQIEKKEASLNLKWKNPTDSNFSGVKVVRKVNSPPQTVSDGKIIYSGKDESLLDSSVSANTKYVYTIFSFNDNSHYSGGVSKEGELSAPTPSEPAKIPPPEQPGSIQTESPGNGSPGTAVSVPAPKTSPQPVGTTPPTTVNPSAEPVQPIKQPTPSPELTASNVSQGVIENTKAVTKLSLQKLSNVVRKAKEFKENKQVQETAATVVAPAVVSVAAIGTAAFVSWTNLIPYLRLLFLQPFMLVGRRKRTGWGQVYNSLNKIPIDLATLRLINAETGKVIQSKVTDKQGRYAFVVNPGKYRIELVKNGFTFPSSLLVGYQDDGRRTDIYHGEEILVTEKDAVITANIPLDPMGEHKKPTRIFWQKLGRRLQLAMSWFGIVVTAMSLYISPRWYVWILLGLHTLLFVIFRRLAIPEKIKSWGIVFDATTQKPVGRVVARLFNSAFNKLVATQITDYKGRYYFLAGDNQYYVTYDHPGFTSEKTNTINLSGKEAENITVDIQLKRAGEK